MTGKDKDKITKEYQEHVESVAKLFRQAPHNLIEEVEKLGFTYVVNDDGHAEEIAEEQAARPTTTRQAELISYLTGTSAPDERMLILWRQETQRDDTLFALWRRYFRAGNAQLKNLILFGLEHNPMDSQLLDNLSFLHSFLAMPKELLMRYMLACELENDPRKFRELARDFDANASSFGYDALQFLQAHHGGNAVKKHIIDTLLSEREKAEQSIAF